MPGETAITPDDLKRLQDHACESVGKAVNALRRLYGKLKDDDERASALCYVERDALALCYKKLPNAKLEDLGGDFSHLQDDELKLAYTVCTLGPGLPDPPTVEIIKDIRSKVAEYPEADGREIVVAYGCGKWREGAAALGTNHGWDGLWAHSHHVLTKWIERSIDRRTPKKKDRRTPKKKAPYTVLRKWGFCPDSNRREDRDLACSTKQGKKPVACLMSPDTAALVLGLSMTEPEQWRKNPGDMTVHNASGEDGKHLSETGPASTPNYYMRIDGTPHYLDWSCPLGLYIRGEKLVLHKAAGNVGIGKEAFINVRLNVRINAKARCFEDTLLLQVFVPSRGGIISWRMLTSGQEARIDDIVEGIDEYDQPQCRCALKGCRDEHRISGWDPVCEETRTAFPLAFFVGNSAAGSDSQCRLNGLREGMLLPRLSEDAGLAVRHVAKKKKSDYQDDHGVMKEMEYTCDAQHLVLQNQVTVTPYRGCHTISNLIPGDDLHFTRESHVVTAAEIGLETGCNVCPLVTPPATCNLSQNRKLFVERAEEIHGNIDNIQDGANLDTPANDEEYLDNQES